MVEFAGWEMPVQYPAGIIAEHRHTREQASLFDVSHMGQLQLTGPQAAVQLEQLSPADILGLDEGRQVYTLLLNDAGGIEDDCMVARLDGSLWMVVNAARRENDIACLRGVLGEDSQLQELDRGLLALQGPAAESVLAAWVGDLADMAFMDVRSAELAHSPCWIARSGYTGEDGFEISCPADRAEAIAELLLSRPEVEPAGLGARDSLRLEAGLCLYGQELTDRTTPVEAGLGWVIAGARRPGGSRPGGFAGAERILNEMEQGVARKRVGLAVSGRVLVRAGAPLFADADSGNPIGEVTSGGFGASLGVPCAMGYVPADMATKGQRFYSLVRGKAIELQSVAAARIKGRK